MSKIIRDLITVICNTEDKHRGLLYGILDFHVRQEMHNDIELCIKDIEDHLQTLAKVSSRQCIIENDFQMSVNVPSGLCGSLLGYARVEAGELHVVIRERNDEIAKLQDSVERLNLELSSARKEITNLKAKIAEQ